jgi:ubiquinone/menaquinone biosynthesis C-methylase UbiE
MLAAGAAAAAEEGRRDVLFVRADATDLPFADGQFDVAVTRLALHHMDAPATALREMARVCCAQARVTVGDMVAAPGAVGDRHNELERLRDPSHTRALRRAELTEVVRRAGIAVDAESEREHAMSAERWLARCRPPEEAGRTVTTALLAEARGGEATGLRAAFEGERLTIRQTWVLIGGTTGR